MGSQTEKLRNPKAKISSLLECLRPVPEPDSDAWKRIRHGFLAEAREFSREAVTSTSQYRHNDWRTRLVAFLSFEWRKKRMIAVVEALLALALLVGGGSGAVYAMQNSLPGSPLYKFKLDVEDMRFENTNHAEARLEQAMAMARNRLEETLRLIQNGDKVPTQVAERYEQNLKAAMAAADECADPDQARARLADELGKQLQRTEQVRNQVQDAGQCQEGECGMLQVLEKTQQALQMNQDTPKGDQEPLQEQERERIQEHQETDDPGGVKMQTQPHQQEQLQNQPQIHQQEQQGTEQEFQNQNQYESQTRNQQGESSPQPEPQIQNQQGEGSPQPEPQIQNQQGEGSPQPEPQTQSHQGEGSPQPERHF